MVSCAFFLVKKLGVVRKQQNSIEPLQAGVQARVKQVCAALA